MRSASLWRRIGAIVYDALLLVALLALATVPVIAFRNGEAVAASTLGFQLYLLVISYAFLMFFWTRFGRTLGMQSWRLRLENMQGERITLRQASLRFTVSILSWLPLGLGYWWQLWDPDGLSWHDRVSATRIVYYPK